MKFDVPLDLTPKERKEIKEKGFQIEKFRGTFFQKCENVDPEHLCSKCTKKRTKTQYIIRQVGYVSPCEQERLKEINDIIAKFSKSTENFLYVPEISKYTIGYLKSQGYRIIMY